MVPIRDPDGRVCLGVITGPHGVRGLVKLNSFTEDPQAVTAYGDPTDASGQRTFRIALQSRTKNQWIARIDGVSDRDAADRLRGVRLYVDRDALPPPSDAEEFYHADLIGLRADGVEGDRVGVVKAVFDFGAGDVLEIASLAGGSLMVPFTQAAVPVVDIAGGRLVIDPPQEVEAAAGEGTHDPDPGASGPDR